LNERPLYASYSDIPPGVTLPTYALEEVLIEKLVALISRTEPRDLYDVYWLLEQGDVDLVFIQANFDAKCRHKGQDPNRFEVALSKKERSFNKLWDLRLAVQVPDLPHLDEVMRAVRRHSRYLDLI
jgi:predicted nucleotidyltransferase component of viral defense system